MASFLSFQPQLLLSPTIVRTRGASFSCSPNRTSSFGFSNHKPFLRGSVGVVRFGFRPPSPFYDFDGAEGLVQEVFRRTESLLYTIADAAVSTSGSDNVEESGDWLAGITNLMENVLKVLKDGLSTLHVPYAYGFAIILLTVLVKAATFPLTKKQVESAMAMRSLQPQVKAIQKQYAGDQERVQLETARLYKLAGVNPFAGCLPTLATIPVWIGLYRALSNVANEGLLSEGFFWIPSLAGPTTIAARQNGSGISWLFPFVDGHPPLGWSDTLAYLVLPVLLVVSQYISIQIMQSSQANDPNMKSSQALTNFLPLMIGYFALSVPSGLSLYWLTNNILSTTQQLWLQKLGGAKNPVRQLSDDTVKEVQQTLQKSATEVSSTKSVESRKEEKSSSGGLPPGERFRRLKEQEARRRQQREAEKMKLAAEGSETIGEAQEEELKVVNTVDEKTKTDLIEVEDQSFQSATGKRDSSATLVAHVNGEQSTHGSNEDHPNTPSSSMKNGGLVSNNETDRQEALSSNGNLEKEEAVEVRITATTMDATVSGEDKRDRVEQQKGNDD